jgi:hypothetical protein
MEGLQTLPGLNQGFIKDLASRDFLVVADSTFVNYDSNQI